MLRRLFLKHAPSRAIFPFSEASFFSKQFFDAVFTQACTYKLDGLIGGSADMCLANEDLLIRVLYSLPDDFSVGKIKCELRMSNSAINRGEVAGRPLGETTLVLHRHTQQLQFDQIGHGSFKLTFSLGEYQINLAPSRASSAQSGSRRNLRVPGGSVRTSWNRHDTISSRESWHLFCLQFFMNDLRIHNSIGMLKVILDRCIATYVLKFLTLPDTKNNSRVICSYSAISFTFRMRRKSKSPVT